MMHCNTLPVAVTLLSLLKAATASSNINATSTATVAIPAGTVIGSVVDSVEYYRGIPYAQPPTGSLRLKPPVRLESFGTVEATGVGPACPQITNADQSPAFLKVLSDPEIEQQLFFGSATGDVTEDCLTISVMRPEGTPTDAKLPVLFWIFGGGFQLGSAQPYNASVLIPRAVAQSKPFILVNINYRLGAFGFLGGSEVLAEGVSNLGLLDQRMGLEWVADNIASFGGDPDAVTIMGESAGAISVFDQLALYDGNNTYKGRPLFRGAIMDSGSIVPTEPVDSSKPQAIFDTVIAVAGCASSSSKLECLRGLDYDTYANASASAPSFLGYHSLSLSYPPRPDGRILTASPEVLAQTGKYAPVPLIIGTQENEGTIFSLFQPNITTKSALVSYLNNIIFQNATEEEVVGLVETYSDYVDNPMGLGSLNGTYPEFRTLASIFGDYFFTFTARILLTTFPKRVPAWSYIATYGRGTPILGTYHVSDVPRLFYETDDVSAGIQDYYISFVHSLNPNNGANGTACGYSTYWPTWQEGGQLLEFGAQSSDLVGDDARTPSFEYVRAHLDTLRI